MLRAALISASTPVRDAVASGLAQHRGEPCSLMNYGRYDAFASEGFGWYDVLFWHVETFTPEVRQQVEALRARDRVVRLVLLCSDVACALWGYQVCAAAVLRTPPQPSELETALRIAAQECTSRQKKAFAFETRAGLCRVYQSGVRRLFLRDRIACVETQDALYESTETLDALTGRLDEGRFLRCGDSVYNLDCIWRIDCRSVTLSSPFGTLDDGKDTQRPNRFPITRDERRVMIERLRARCL